jgi:hypothetical protein
MLGNYRVASQLVASRVVLSSIELVGWLVGWSVGPPVMLLTVRYVMRVIVIRAGQTSRWALLAALESAISVCF